MNPNDLATNFTKREELIKEFAVAILCNPQTNTGDVDVIKRAIELTDALIQELE